MTSSSTTTTRSKRKTKITPPQPDWLGSYKPLPPPAPPPASDSPSFVAVFSDRTRTRMTIYAFIDRLDEALPRAIAVSRAAYSARHGIPVAKIKATIRAARFENKESGDVLKAYTARELAGHNSHKAAA